MDIFDHGFAAKIILYVFFGILDAMWQTTAYWLMGAMCNDPAKLAHFAGFCACALTLATICSFYHCLQTRHYSQLVPQAFGAQMACIFRE